MANICFLAWILAALVWTGISARYIFSSSVKSLPRSRFLGLTITRFDDNGFVETAEVVETIENAEAVDEDECSEWNNAF